jgi:hypothetical protein
MPKAEKPTKIVNQLSLEEIIEEFLKLALIEPEKTPKRLRDQRDNTMIIIGFNRAQETLRSILSTHGNTDEVKKLAEIRDEHQQKPMEGPGGIKMWVAG